MVKLHRILADTYRALSRDDQRAVMALAKSILSDTGPSGPRVALDTAHLWGYFTAFMKRINGSAEKPHERVAEWASIESACSLAGIHRDTYYEWRRRRDLGPRIDAALAEGEAALVATVRQAGGQDWRAAAWILERRYPATWARRVEIDAATVNIEWDNLTDNQLARIAAGESPLSVLRR
jgi:hypothetical protein